MTVIGALSPFRERSKMSPHKRFAPKAAVLRLGALGMKNVLDDLVRYMRPVYVAGVDVTDAGIDGGSQQCDRYIAV